MKKSILYSLLALVLCITASCETESYDIDFNYAFKNTSSDTIHIALSYYEQNITLAPKDSMRASIFTACGFLDKAQYDAAIQSNLEQEAKPKFMYGAVLTVGADSVKLSKAHNDIPNTPMSVLSYTRTIVAEHENSCDLLFTYTFTDEVIEELFNK